MVDFSMWCVYISQNDDVMSRFSEILCSKFKQFVEIQFESHAFGLLRIGTGTVNIENSQCLAILRQI